ncbi:MAG TPA: hypothetical protein PKE04_18380, partial [Clostridia bacterium]|nr:hypothetical protein [Clostridia bacterium]
MKRQSFRFQLVALSIVVMAAAVLTFNELVTARFVDTLWTQDGEAINKQFSIVDRQLTSLLNTARMEASVIDQRDIVQDLVLGRASTRVERILRSVRLIERLREALSGCSALGGVLFYYNGQVYGVTPNINIRREQDSEFDRLALSRQSTTSTAVQWIGAYPLQSMVNITLTSASLLQERYLAGLSRRWYHSVDQQISGYVTVATLVDVKAIESLYAHLEDASSQIYVLDSRGRSIGSEAPNLPAFPDEPYGQLDWQGMDSQYHLFYYRLSGLNGILVQRTDINVYRAATRSLRMHGYLIGVLVLVAMAALYALLARLLLKRFRIITEVFYK